MGFQVNKAYLEYYESLYNFQVYNVLGNEITFVRSVQALENILGRYKLFLCTFFLRRARRCN